MPQYTNTEGIVINKKVVKEADILVTFLTPSLGKIVAVAKGATNIKSSRLGALQLGNIVKVHLYQKNNFTWASEVTTTVAFLNQSKNLVQLNLLFYCLEIVNYFIAEDQLIEGIYPIVKKLILAVNLNQFRDFIAGEIKFIEALGFGVPSEISREYQNGNLKLCQSYLKKYLESIIEKPLESNKLFK